jgi:type IV pilus assembly protein PilQ
LYRLLSTEKDNQGKSAMAPKKETLKRGMYVVLAIILSIVFAGCNKEIEVPQDTFYDEWRALAKTSQPSSPPDTEVSVELPQKEEELRQQVEEEAMKKPAPKPLPKSPVSMTMRDTDVNVILRALARIADQNIMMNKEVSGVTNINVIEAPWDEVFQGILRTRGLTYTWEGNIIRVMTLADMQHDSAIESALQVKQAQSIERKQVEPLLTEVIPIDYADAEALAENLNALLTTTGEEGKEGQQARKGSITVNKHNNALIIEAISDDIAKIVPLVNKLDRPTPQVLIDAKIVETTRETARELGVKWGGLYHGTSGGDNYFVTPGANAVDSEGNFPVAGPVANFPAPFASEVPVGQGFTLGYLALGADYVLDVELSALEKQNKLNILSSPALTTLDNRSALISAGEKVPYETFNQLGSSNIEWEEANLSLEVTPHVIDGKALRLEIVVHKDEVDFTREVRGQPTIITKTEQTTLILLDGQTTVVGGISKDSDAEGDEGVPGLKNIPGLGYLFKGEAKRARLEEMLIFITPRILKEKNPESPTVSVSP